MGFREQHSKPKRGAVLVDGGKIEITIDSYTKVTRKVRDSDYDDFPNLGEKPPEQVDLSAALEADVSKMKVRDLMQCLDALGVDVPSGVAKPGLIELLETAREEHRSGGDDSEGDAESGSE